jgi:hypothetical protein
MLIAFRAEIDRAVVQFLKDGWYRPEPFVLSELRPTEEPEKQ